MRKFILLAIMFIAMNAYGQDTVRMDTSNLKLKEGVAISKSGIKYSRSGKTYTEIYDVVTDSIVYKFGLEFKSSDSTFVRKVCMDSCNRKVYDMMKRTTQQMVDSQEEARKETVEFLNRYRASTEIWLMFKLYDILKK